MSDEERNADGSLTIQELKELLAAVAVYKAIYEHKGTTQEGLAIHAINVNGEPEVAGVFCRHNPDRAAACELLSAAGIRTRGPGDERRSGRPAWDWIDELPPEQRPRCDYCGRLQWDWWE